MRPLGCRAAVAGIALRTGRTGRPTVPFRTRRIVAAPQCVGMTVRDGPESAAKRVEPIRSVQLEASGAPDYLELRTLQNKIISITAAACALCFAATMTPAVAKHQHMTRPSSGPSPKPLKGGAAPLGTPPAPLSGGAAPLGTPPVPLSGGAVPLNPP